MLEELKLRWEAKLEASDVFNAEEGVADDGKEYATDCAPVRMDGQFVRSFALLPLSGYHSLHRWKLERTSCAAVMERVRRHQRMTLLAGRTRALGKARSQRRRGGRYSLTIQRTWKVQKQTQRKFFHLYKFSSAIIAARL